MGGLSAAIDLSRQGAQVTVVDQAAGPGGKMREVDASGRAIDAGPTVFTMRWIFEELFNDAGTAVADELALSPATLLARHAWTTGGRLDLFADIDASADAIATFANGREAAAYRRFCTDSADMFSTLKNSFIAAQKPNMLSLVSRVGFTNIAALLRTRPMQTMWSALNGYFKDPRLIQLFGRYATYCGSSPLSAPATLMLIAHVEQDGVWLLRDGMHALAQAMQSVGTRHGATYRFGEAVAEITSNGKRASGVTLASGEHLPADAVVFNGDTHALASGLLGTAATGAVAATRRKQRSLSAVTWCLQAKTSDFDLAHHSVFFAADYPSEFQNIFDRRTMPAEPTVYVCAQDRHEHRESPADAERLLVLINAPPDGDGQDRDEEQLSRLYDQMHSVVSRCGLTLQADVAGGTVTSPDGFDALFPATGGALYGRSSHGTNASFERPGSRSRLKGLYLAGGSVHPGPGVPMTAMSGRLAAASLLQDWQQR
jgi:1-hydroxycarotenoid 3,4-desaturase